MALTRIPTGTYSFDAPCPNCGVVEAILISLSTSLTIRPDDVGSLKATLSSKAVDHDCGQGQPTLLDALEPEPDPAPCDDLEPHEPHTWGVDGIAECPGVPE